MLRAVLFTEASRTDHGPIQTAALQAALTSPLPNQDQAEQVEGMQPTASAEGTHQHHALQSQRAASLHLRLHSPGIHLKGTRQIDRRSSARGDHQCRAALQRMEQRFRRVQLKAKDLKESFLLGLGES